MTVILPERVECPGCGESFEVYVMHSDSTFGDGPAIEHRDRAECPSCGREIEKQVIEFVEPADDSWEVILGGRWIPGRSEADANRCRRLTDLQPTPVNRSVEEILAELGVEGASLAEQRRVVAKQAWRLHSDEARMLRNAGLQT